MFRNQVSLLILILTYSNCHAEDCKPGWTSAAGKCYKLFSEKRMNWYNALAHCRSLGGNLAAINGETENEEMSTQLLGYDENAWIGMNNIRSTSQFVWSDLSSNSYDNWGSSESTRSDAKGCVYIRRQSYASLWFKDLNCWRKRRFICQTNMSSGNQTESSWKPEIPVDSSSSSGECLAGWSQVGSKCYKVFSEERVAWKDALRSCRSFGKNFDLASISNAEENDHVKYLMSWIGYGAWLGLNDLKQEGKFFWSDKSDVDFTGWARREPNDFGRNEDCVEMMRYIYNDFQWNDMNCNLKRFFVCQFDKNAN